MRPAGASFNIRNKIEHSTHADFGARGASGDFVASKDKRVFDCHKIPRLGRNASVKDGVIRALGRPPRDFQRLRRETARRETAATNVSDVRTRRRISSIRSTRTTRSTHSTHAQAPDSARRPAYTGQEC